MFLGECDRTVWLEFLAKLTGKVDMLLERQALTVNVRPEISEKAAAYMSIPQAHAATEHMPTTMDQHILPKQY